MGRVSASLNQRLDALRKLKKTAEAKSRSSRDAGAAFKQAEARTYAALDAAGVESMKVKGTLFSLVEKVDGYVEDRAEYIDWALRQDDGLNEFIQENLIWAAGFADAPDGYEALCKQMIEAFYNAIKNTELVTYKEDGQALNAIARAHIDDGAPMPPGVNFRPKNYISQRSA